MQNISPFLWFDSNAEEAVRFYLKTFRRSRLLDLSPGPDGKAFSLTFELDGLQLMALNGGPHLKISSGISFFIGCKTQKEIDRLWSALSKGGEQLQCGWVTDRFGVTWQVVPDMLGEVLGGDDPAGAARAMQAMLGMVKLDIAKLRQAYKGPAKKATQKTRKHKAS